MSYTFTIKSRVTATLETLFAEAGFPDVACREGVDQTSNWPQGVTHFYRPGVSCRAVEVTSDANLFDVRIMAHSSPDDFELALGLIEVAARQTGASIHSEDGDTVDVDAFRSRFDDAWVRDMVRSPFGMFNMIRNQGGTACVHGAKRPFELGPAMLHELGFGEDTAKFQQRFFDAFRSLQWMNLDDYFEASVMVVTPNGSTEQKTLSTIGAPGMAYLLNRVELIGAQTSCGELIFIPWDRLPEAFGERFRRLHEDLVTIDPIPATEWPGVSEQMKRVSVSLV